MMCFTEASAAPEAVAAHARSICAALVDAPSTCLCCTIIALPPSVSNGDNGIICLPASSIPPNMDAFPADDDAVAAVPPKKLVYAAVAAEPATEATPLFPWLLEEATAN